jgi:O-antigen/teichoic acid export membrane protein
LPSIKNNIAANLTAGVWTTLLTAAITPLQVNLLGIESYGLIGFIATLQIVFSAFDLGLSSTLTREIASDSSHGKARSIDLIRTATAIYWSFSLLVSIVLVALTSSISESWFKAQTMSALQLEKSIYIIILFLALRWPVALYTGIMSGLQKMVVINIIKISIVSVRLLGGIAVILAWRNIESFLLWTAFSALIEVVAYYLVCQRYWQFALWKPKIHLGAIKAVWGFSLSMSVISILALFISQLDRILVSRLETLNEFGYYTLAFNTAAITSLVISAVSTAMLPSFSAWQAKPVISVLQSRYLHAMNVTLYLVGGASFALIFFGKLVLALWIGHDAAAGAFLPLALLAAGFWLNAAVSNAYSVAVALGKPNLPLMVSAASAIPYAAILYWLISHYGITGAAMGWLLLNACYVIILIPLVHRKLLSLPTFIWLARILGMFALLGVGSFGGVQFIVSRVVVPENRWIDIVALALGGMIYCLGGLLLLGPTLRSEIFAMLRSLLAQEEK